MIVSALQTTNPAYNKETWEDYWALYKGGQDFDKRIRRFLIQNPGESPEVYELRVKEAFYHSYIASAVDYYSAMLCGSGRLEMVPKDEDGETITEVPPFSRAYLTDCDGAGTDFIDLIRTTFTQSMSRGGCSVALDFPGLHTKEVPQNQKEWEVLGWGNVKTRIYDRSHVLDWEYDRKHNLEWIVCYEERNPRPNWQEPRNLIEYVWTVFDREFVYEYTVAKEKGKALDYQRDEAILTGTYRHALGFVPVVMVETPEHLWVTDKLKSAQVEHFRLSCAQNWGIRRSCFTMPVTYMDGDLGNPTFGHGYTLQLPQDARMEWLAPNVDYLSHTHIEIRNQVVEMYRIIGQMSLSMDNNAVVVGRSAESKMADAESVRTLLNAYGSFMRNTAERIMQYIGAAVGETTHWTAAGLDRAVGTDPKALIDTLSQASALDICSDKFWQQGMTKFCVSVLPEATYDEREAMRKEIEANIAEWHQERKELQSLSLLPAGATSEYNNDATASGNDAGARVSGNPAASLEKSAADT